MSEERQKEKAREYLHCSGKSFNFRDFMFLVQGDISARKFIEKCRIGSVFTVYSLKDPYNAGIPSLKTVRRIAEYIEADAEELWLAVCRQVYREKEDFTMHRR